MNANPNDTHRYFRFRPNLTLNDVYRNLAFPSSYLQSKTKVIVLCVNLPGIFYELPVLHLIPSYLVHRCTYGLNYHICHAHYSPFHPNLGTLAPRIKSPATLELDHTRIDG